MPMCLGPGLLQDWIESSELVGLRTAWEVRVRVMLYSVGWAMCHFQLPEDQDDCSPRLVSEIQFGVTANREARNAFTI